MYTALSTVHIIKCSRNVNVVNRMMLVLMLMLMLMLVKMLMLLNTHPGTWPALPAAPLPACVSLPPSSHLAWWKGYPRLALLLEMAGCSFEEAWNPVGLWLVGWLP